MTTDEQADGTRVLFVSDHFGYADSVIHGATRYFLSVLPRLALRVADLEVAFLRGVHPASRQLRDLGVIPRFFGRRKWSPLAVWDVYRLVRRERIDIIHSAGMKGILTARIAGKLAGVPVVSHLHDCEPVPGPLRWLLRWTRNWSAWTLAVSRDVAEHSYKTLRMLPQRTEVLLNGLALEEMRGTPESAGLMFRQRYGMPAEVKVIGIIGRLSPVKGHDTLLRATPAVLAKYSNARLVIVGEGPEHESLERRAHELGLTGYVVFTGQLANVYEALRAIDVVVMPSLREGLPYSLLEAMAMDKPIVASAVGGLGETIRHCENGVLVRPNDAQALAKAILSVFNDPVLVETISHGAHETIKRFDIERHVDRLATIYRALVSGETVPTVAVHPTSGDGAGRGETASPSTVGSSQGSARTDTVP